MYVIVSSNGKEWKYYKAWLQLFNTLFFFLNQAEDLLRREKNLEEAKKIVIKNDPSLPEPKCVSKSQCTWYMACVIASCLHKDCICLCFVALAAVEGHCPFAVHKRNCFSGYLCPLVYRRGLSHALDGYLNFPSSHIRLLCVCVCLLIRDHISVWKSSLVLFCLVIVVVESEETVLVRGRNLSYWDMFLFGCL